MDLPRDLIELFSAFANAKVRYLLVGGHAVAAHGRPRSTKDVDLWLAPEADNVQRACKALLAFGVPGDIVRALSESGADDIVWLGRAPMRVDLLRSLVGVEFEDAWSKRLAIDVGGVPVPLIGKADLIRNKLAVGRPQDRRDVRMLQGPATKRRSRSSTSKRKPKQ